MNDAEEIAAIYCRLSEEDKHKQNINEDSLSIQNQKTMLLSYAMQKGWKVYNIYSDDDFAGADRNRPAFHQLLVDAEAGKFNIILCKSQSRFTREMELVEKYLHNLFPLWGIRFISIVDYADTADKGNKKSRQINGLVNEWYIENLSEDIKKTLTARRKEGHHIGAFSVYGYKKNPEKKGHLIIDEDAAKVVREVFELFASGIGKSEIARILNARDIPNPTEYKRQQGLRFKMPESKRSTYWQYYAIAKMLDNEMYIGNMVQGRYGSISYKTKQNKPRAREEWIIVENTHAPIINRALWDRVQELIEEKAKPGWMGEVGIFARKAKCVYCGYTMRSAKNASGHRYLKCNTKHMKKDACMGGFIGQKELTESVLIELNIMVGQYLDFTAAEGKIQMQDAGRTKLEAYRREKIAYARKITEAEEAAKTLYLDRVHGIISVEEYKRLSDTFYEEKQNCERLLEECNACIYTLEQQKEELKTKKQLLEQYSNIEVLTHDIVNAFIDYIEVGKRSHQGAKEPVPIIIHWKF